MSDELAQEIAFAIIRQAARDYRSALKRQRRHPDSITNNRMIDDCERFFRSRWFGLMTPCDPDLFLERLRKDAAQDAKPRKV